MQQISEDFLKYLAEKSRHIPEKVIEKAKDCLCDYIAVTEAGAAANKDRWHRFLENVPQGPVQLLGYPEKTDGKTACLVNGYNAHSLELDDGQRFGMIHLGASVISALHSAAAEHTISQRDFLTGIIMGYEAACRVAISVQPSHKNCGFHAAGTCGTIGSAIGVAFALGMSFMQMKTVLSAAAASAAGMLEIQEQGSELKPYNLGRAAMDGLAAAYMGFTTFCGPDDILGGERGFLKLFCRESCPEKLFEYQDYFEIERIYVKPYAACRHCHSAIEAAMNLRRNINPDCIEKIVVSTYRLAVKGHDHTAIAGPASAKLSIPYCVAAALILGRADPSAFSAANVDDPKILALAKRVEVAEDPDFTACSPQKRIAKVDIRLSDGSIQSAQVDYAKGDPENPISRKEILEKAQSLSGTEATNLLVKRLFSPDCNAF